ncbi:hypothetical protein MOQ_008130 [Trypanosoma cruzi marinkellei]|uniref:Uncharacterized protein n=1 Tax=Trypanosoma cruzi marinkellei TaxID=85056 RepID=K2MR91_TRYCR|nr:hypothetical protein MOQ_008130 [Trypanosoma cruzi marinkellei]
MTDVEESLLELRRLIARARREGGGGTHGKENDNEPPEGCQISVKELERRFAGLEEKLFREKGLREQARELHQRAKRRKQQQRCSVGQEQWKDGSVPVEASRNASYDRMGVGTMETVATETMSREVSSHLSSSLNSSPPLQQEVPTCDKRRHRDGSHVEEAAESPRGVYGASCVTDPDAHLLVDITDGSTRLEGIGVGPCTRNNNKEVFCSSSCCCFAPYYSFAHAYADDDRQRLLFIVDQLSNILREERRQKEILLSHVLTPMVRHIEVLERDLVLQQREMTALKREFELLANPRHVLRSKSVRDEEKMRFDDIGEKSNEEDPVLILLQSCEEQLLRLTEDRRRRM